MDLPCNSEAEQALDLSYNRDERIQKRFTETLTSKNVHIIVELDLKNVLNLVNIPTEHLNKQISIRAQANAYTENKRFSNTDTNSTTSKYVTPLTTVTEDQYIHKDSNLLLNIDDITPLDLTTNAQGVTESSILMKVDLNHQNMKINKKNDEVQTDLKLSEEDYQILQLVKSHDMTYQKVKDIFQRARDDLREDINYNSNEINDYHDEQNDCIMVEDEESNLNTVTFTEDQLLPLVNHSNNNKALIKKALECFIKKPDSKKAEIAKDKEGKGSDVMRLTNTEEGAVATETTPVKPPTEALKPKYSNPLKGVRKIVATQKSCNNYLKWIKRGQDVTKNIAQQHQYQGHGSGYAQFLTHAENTGESIYTMNPPATTASTVQNTMQYMNYNMPHWQRSSPAQFLTHAENEGESIYTVTPPAAPAPPVQNTMQYMNRMPMEQIQRPPMPDSWWGRVEQLPSNQYST